MIINKSQVIKLINDSTNSKIIFPCVCEDMVASESLINLLIENKINFYINVSSLSALIKYDSYQSNFFKCIGLQLEKMNSDYLLNFYNLFPKSMLEITKLLCEYDNNELRFGIKCFNDYKIDLSSMNLLIENKITFYVDVMKRWSNTSKYYVDMVIRYGYVDDEYTWTPLMFSDAIHSMNENVINEKDIPFLKQIEIMNYI